MDAKASGGRVVAVVGSRSSLGRRLVAALGADPTVEKIVAIDLRPPPALLGDGPPLPARKLVYQRIDLTHPAAAPQLVEVFHREEVGAVAHLAFWSAPHANLAYARELEEGGTARVLEACEAAGVEHLVVRSSTLVYGVSPHHPALLREDSAFGGEAPPFIESKRQAEALALSKVPGDGLKVTVLRFAQELGAGSGSLLQRYLLWPLAPSVLGFDPLVQAVDEGDAVAVLVEALRRRAPGLFNVAPEGALPLRSALHLVGTPAVPAPLPVAAFAMRSLRSVGITPAWQEPLIDLLRAPLVADGGKLREAWGFRFRRDVRGAMEGLKR